MDRFLIALNSHRIESLVRSTKRTIMLVCPGMTVEIAKTIVRKVTEGVEATIVIDPNEGVFRLGYGEVGALRVFQDAGIEVRQSAGLRIGVLMADNAAFAFTPTPLCLETERLSNETPNAVRLLPIQAEEIARRIAKAELEGPVLPGMPEPDQPEIGNTLVTKAELESVEQSLTAAPPLNFDIQRQVHVFQPYIQYVELGLTGCTFSRHVVRLPSSIAPLGRSRAVQDRLKMTYSLIGKHSKLSDKPLQEELNVIRNTFTHPIKSLTGRVMLRNKRETVNKRIGALQKQVDKHKRVIKAKLQKEINRSIEDLKKLLLPAVLRNSPDGLLANCVGSQPTKGDADQWLETQLRKTFRDAEALIEEIELKCVYKDVTFEGLNRPELQSELRRAFPSIPWNKAFEEFNAIRASDTSEASAIS